MRTYTLDPRSAHFIRDWPDWLPQEHCFSVSVFKHINADRVRIIQALTEPEYIETWFYPPGALTGRTFVLPWQESLLICWSCADGASARILCSYRVYRRSKLLITWSRISGQTTIPSFVKMQLLGDFERTIVQLTHVGLLRSDLSFYEDLWNASLEKLNNLFSASSIPSNRKTHAP